MNSRHTVLVALLALTVLPSAFCWIGPSFFTSLGPPLLDVDDMDFPSRRFASPRSILRDADKTFRQLEKFVDRVADTLVGGIPDQEELVGRQGQGRLHPKQHEGGNQTALATKPNAFEMRLRPSFEWKETDHGFLLTAATPGLRKEDLIVEVVEAPKGGGHYLVISGESKHSEKKGGESDKTMSFQATYKKFEQRVRLPEGVDKNTLTAKYDDGMLQVHIAYPEEEKFERKKITIN